MIKIFRQVREQLLKDNQMKKYTLYAIGEIVLVVLGILIALQINNWNEDKKDRTKEKKVLISLLEDFKYSQSKLKSSLEVYPNKLKNLESALNTIGKSSEELNEEMKDFHRRTGYRTTEIAEGSIQSVLNTEKLELIKNDTLKKLLTAYPSGSNNFKSQETLVINIVLNLHRPILESYISLTEFISDDKIRFPHLKEKAIPSDFIGLINDKKYQNVLVNRILQTNNLIKVAKDFLARIEVIISLLEHEIKNS